MMSRHVSSNKPLRETMPRNKIWAKPTDQMDLWLDSQGYYRKHTAKDGSCLYRAISEQIFLAQAFHLEVRKQCADYAKRHPELLSSITHCSLDDYIEQMRYPHEAGGNLELQLMSLMYRKDFLVFLEVGKTFQSLTNHGFDDKIMLCLSQDRHYDSVYTKQFISNAAFCQSLVYDVLYKGVFELLEVDYAVKKMLHDKTSKYQRDPSSFLMNGLALRLEIRDSYVNVKDLLTLGVTPFPYKVAKSLDPDIYRNVEYDTWNDLRRGMRYGMYLWNNRELQVGAKCLVKLQSDQVCHAHIQEMAPNKGPVLVFVEELGEKMTVTYDSLELLPQPSSPQTLPLPIKQLKNLQSIKDISAITQEIVSQEDVSEKEKTIYSRIDHRNQDKESVWREDLEIDGRTTPKLKMFSEISRQNKKSTKAYRSKTKDQHHTSNEVTKSRIETNSVVSSSDCNYQQQETMSFQHDSYEDYNSQGYIHQEASDTAVEEPKVAVAEMTPPTTTMVCIEPQHYYTDSFSHPTYCYVPHKSVLPDGSDLPLADMTTLRFYYNYGIDHYARGVRPTPPCYLNTTVAYVPDTTTVSPAPGYDCNSTITSPDSAVVMSPVYSQRPNSLPVVPSPVVHEPDSTTYNTQNVAPRFKNKMRTMQGRQYDPPAIQQPEVSSTTNIPVATHYIPPPLYYHPVECEAFCPANFVEYSVYDPTIFYPPPHPPPAPTHYIHPDALFYQHVVAAPLPSTV